MMDGFGVHSEVGKLRKVMVHRPELSLQRLTPSNHDELLFDDVLWVERAQYEHDQFVARMRERGVEVFVLRDLLAEALAASDEGRRRLIELTASEYTVGVSLVDEVRAALWDMKPDQLAKHLIGGLTVAESGLDLGTLGSTLNPFATGIASGFAGIPISDGLISRLVILLIGLAIGTFFVLRYADRVKRDPAASVVHDMKEDNEARFRATAGEGDVQALTGKHKVILAVFGLAFAVMMYGVIPWEDLGVGLPTLWWWFPEMTASFLLFAVIIGLIGRLGEGQLTEAFINGARDLLGVALIIGIARGITVVMNNGQITDTVLHWAELALGDVGEVAFSIVMYGLFLPLSFLIPSSSGLATVSMPIMSPLAGFVGVPKDLVVTAYQSASGLMNLFIPTSAVVMGGLAIARVPYGRYLRWVWPLLAMLAAVTIVVLGAGALLA
jgi:uncharacterized ion transporter superfamily protein YfcC